MAASAGMTEALSDDLLGEILIRLPSLPDLGRACGTCTAFRRVIASRSFLRRVHALHPPSLLGLRNYYGGFQPVEQPHASVVAGGAVGQAADFRFRSLPDPGFWAVRDARDGRFVLDLDEKKDSTFTTIAVCDPLFRRHVLLPPIPGDLAAAVDQEPFAISDCCRRRCEIFLVPCGEAATATEEAEASVPFKIIWMAQCPTKLVVFLFSSASSQWRAIAAPSWKDMDPAMAPVAEEKPMFWRSYAHGCFYWSLHRSLHRCLNLVALNAGTMEFSTVGGPPRSDINDEMAAVELGESKLGIFRFSNCDSVLELYCASQGQGANNKWALQNIVSLPTPYTRMLGVAEGKLILQTRRRLGLELEFRCVSLDFKTLQLQTVRETLRGGYCSRALPVIYAGYPPSLSSPTV
ncbi:hypothetical protein ACP70R_004526 [Stipagrostis hirtigluma subsp. patula]